MGVVYMRGISCFHRAGKLTSVQSHLTGKKPSIFDELSTTMAVPEWY